MPTAGAQQTQQLQARHAGQSHITDQTAGIVVAGREKTFGAVVVSDVDVKRTQQRTQRAAIASIRFDYCDSGAIDAHDSTKHLKKKRPRPLSKRHPSRREDWGRWNRLR